MEDPLPDDVADLLGKLSPKARQILEDVICANPQLDPTIPMPPGITKAQFNSALAELLTLSMMPPEPARKRKSRRAKKAQPAATVQLRIDLEHVLPPVWRRFTVPADILLSDLHEAIQIVMGWTNSHLHAFEIGGLRYATPNPYGGDEELDMEDATKHTLDEFVTVGAKFHYTYDFGDDWSHVIKVEKFAPAADLAPFQVLAGKRACPPEDCGGPWGYGDLLEAIGDPKNEQHDEMLEWVGGEFDSEAFDLKGISKVLQRASR